MAATNVAVYLLLYLMCVSVSGDLSPSNTYPQNGYGDTFTNLAVYKQTLLIGAKNEVLILNRDNLTEIRQFSTCPISTPNCNNINTVLLVGAEEHLILCGTANGTCQRSKLPAMELKSSNQKLSDNSTSKPIIAFATQSGLVYFAVSYNGKWENKFKPLLLYRTSSFSRIKWIAFARTFETSSFEMYFKAGFSHKGFSYFLTNQHYSVGNSTFVSKLVQLCQKDSDPDKTGDQFFSYTDIVISCGTYTFLQDAVVVDLPQNSSVMVATFTKGDNPESLTQSSAICVFSMEEIEDAVFKERKNALVCPNTTTSHPCGKHPSNIIPKDLYFANNIGDRIDASKFDSFRQEIRCTTSVETWYSIIGVLFPLHKEPVFYKDSKIFTKLNGVTASKDYTAIYVGTQNGNVIKLNLYNMTKADEYQSVTVEPEHPITAIIVDEQYELFLTDTKLYQFPRYRCDIYTTCPQLMAARDPNCGWCVYTGRSTRKSDCPGTLYNHWLSALDQCVSLRSDPGGIPVRTSSTVTIILTPTVGLLLNQTYSCLFSRKVGDGLPFKVNATIDGSNITCVAPIYPNHSRASLSLRVNNTILATGDFVFYNCSDYKNCTDCTSAPGKSCVWEFNTTRCTSPSASGVPQTPDTCPQLRNSRGSLYVHSNSPTDVVIYGNLLDKIKHLPLKCFFPGNRTKTFPATVLNDTITCKITFPLNANEPERKVDIGVMYASTSSRLDDVHHNYVTVYSCATKGPDCSICLSLPMSNSYYNCGWCGHSCDYNYSTCPNICPPPSIIEVTPESGPKSGGTTITITGSELGPSLDSVSVTIADLPCRTENFTEEFIISKQIVCQTAKSSNSEGNSDVIVTVDNQSSNQANFSYLTPTVTDIKPKKGPQAGGTRITLTGENLVIGNQRYIVKLTSTNGTSIHCLNPNAQGNSSVTCKVPALQNGTTISEIKFCIDDLSETGCNLKFKEKGIYTYGPNPSDINITPTKSIKSGGTVITVRGKGLAIAQDVYVSSSKSTETVSCTDRSDTQMLCKFPKMSESVRQRRSTDSGVETITVIINLDGYSATFDVQYFRDPELAEFADDVLLFSSDQRNLEIQGQYLNLVATTTDFKITIGLDNCVVVELTNNTLTCAAPKSQPESEAGVQYPAVNVSIGNINKRIGHLRYEEEIDKIKTIVIIVSIVTAVVIGVIAVVIVLLVRKNRASKKKTEKVQKYVKTMEMEIKNVAREEFADMQNSMTMVSTNLVERGFPYFNYHQYAFNMLFPTDEMESHPLMHDPVVSNIQVSDDVRLKLKNSMKMFEDLISNKFFIISVISTMERQRKFTLKDKSNMAGSLSTVLLGKMEYFHEILRSLLNTLVQDAVSKKSQKTLFRRGETITEKLLTNWLSLCLHPHMKKHTGSQLYLMLKATQVHMESGPIDAVTQEAKYTLSEEKLLKKYTQQAAEGSNEPTFAAKMLTLNVVINMGEEVYPCKVLDCDTISQVKMKCLNQIYVNYPASDLTLGPSDLDLEWRAGFSGCLKLGDEDKTAKCQDGWVRLNTLAHYSVKTDSNMALVDQHSAMSNTEDYVNLAQIQLDNIANVSLDSTDAMISSHDEENPASVRRWHLVKPDDENLKSQNMALAELYLNRLLSTKLAILDYVKTLFDYILNTERVPPPVHFLFNYLDDLALQHKVEIEALHAWKSHSYPIRVWAAFITKPNKIFDVQIPSYVDSSLEVISQAFIDSFSATSQTLSKNSPSHKLLFNQESAIYRERVQTFYSSIRPDTQSNADLRQYLDDLDKLQMTETRFNKMSALYKLYNQLQPYFPDIIQDLEDGEGRSLQLDKKLEAVIRSVEE